MSKLLHKKLNKKGFTLAELLVVIAIIAILVAIAVPIFTGALDNARIARDEANVRSAKGAAITLILTDKNTNLAAGTWYAEVTFKEDGDVKSVKLVDAEGNDAAKAIGSIKYDETTTYTITITGTDLKPSSGGNNDGDSGENS